jgi:hypothetical protein
MKFMNKDRFKFALVLALAVALAPRAAHAVGETTGRIEGNITEAQTGAPIPGATITVSSPALIGGTRTITTNSDGQYEAISLPPGRYEVEVSYSGVKPIKRRVVVRQGETLPLNIAWSPELAEAEVTVVVEERHYTKPDSTQTGTVVSAESESKIALGDRRYQWIASQVAGVTPSSSALGGATFQQVKGGNYLQNRYMVDGLDTSDPVTGTFSANMNFDSVASEEVLTGGMEAQYNSLGGVFNIITTAGSDDWHVDTSFYINNASFSAPNKFGGSNIDAYQPFSSKGAPDTSKYQAMLNVGGPILKHRLWFNISLEYLYEQFGQAAGPPIGTIHPAYYRHQVLGRLKFTWAPNEKHRITLAISSDPALLYNVNGRYQGESHLGLGITENQQNQFGTFATIQWEYFKSQNLNVSVQGGFIWNDVDNEPQGILTPSAVEYGPNDNGYLAKNFKYNRNQPRHVNADDGTVWYNGLGPAGSDNKYSVALDPSLSVRGRGAGYHDAKFGIQSKYTYRKNNNYWAGNGVFNDAGGGGGEGGLCNASNLMDPKAAPQVTGNGKGCNQYTSFPSYVIHENAFSIGAFVQDRWKPFKRLTILPGIRLDYGYTANSAGQTVSNLVGIGPRLGFTVDLTGDQKTIFTAYYGRANDVASLLPAATAEVIPTQTTYQFDGKSFVKDHDAQGPGGIKVDPNLTTPHSDEVTVSLRREIFRNTSAAIDYTWKQESNLWDQMEINQIWDPSGTHVIGYKDGTAHQVLLLTTPDKSKRTYQGIDFIVEARPTQNWDFYAAYTLSWLYGAGQEQFGQLSGNAKQNGAFYNPRQTMFYDGYLIEDSRHNLRLRASYTTHGVSLGGQFSYISGGAASKEFFNRTDGDYTNKRSPQGTDPGSGNSSNQISEFRLPDQFEVDLRAQYDFYALIRQHLLVMVDFLNLFNGSAATIISNNNDSNFSNAAARQRPFQFQIGLRYFY